MTLTNMEYIESQGTNCPHCRGTNLQGIDGVEVDAGKAEQHIRCMDCDETWWDVYELIAWEPVFTGGGSTVYPVKICDNCLYHDQPIGMTVQVVEQGDGTCEWDGCAEKEN